MSVAKYINGLFSSVGNVVVSETPSDIGEITGTVKTNGGLSVRNSDGQYMKLVDGTSSTAVVKTASDLSGTLDSTTLYIIDGVVDMGAQSIEVPPGGISIEGLSVNVSKLVSSADDYDMFTSPAGGSGDLFLAGLTMETSGSNSQVFALTDATGFHAVEGERVNFDNCTSVGYLDGYRQGLLLNWGFFSCEDGLECRSNWAGGFRASTGIVRNFGSSGVMFKAGAGLVFNSRFLADTNAIVPSGSNFADFSASNFASDTLFEIVGANFTGDGVPIPNIDETDVKCLWRSNVGVGNTFRGGRWSCTSEATTVISSSGTYVKVAGTTAYSDLQHCSNTTNNAIVYDGVAEAGFELTASITFSGSSNKVIRVRPRIWDNSAGVYIDRDFFQAKISSGPSGTRTENISILDIITLGENDRVELWVSNETDTSNLTLNLGGAVILDER